ncbi:DUF4280 domain-containing protein [uncultured Flavobacterium sp.]|uniref:DUF4280 domain-containing protein n=1 Tax=uncultured Flavobacterium sp. TaxID=165435 RepID=UPI002930E001|nr:DUF4280 domain-containing protein [uncultured Flavobacterium sp.]
MAKPDNTLKRKEREEKENAEDGLKFVIDGAKLKCDLCTVPAGDLKVNFDTPTIQDKKVATVVEKDKKSLIFKGNCKKSPQSSSPCASVMKLADWKDVGTVYFQDEFPLLLKSTIKCEYGGVDIKITDSAQRNEIEKIDTTAAPVPSVESTVTDIYFAKKIVTPIYERTEETIIAKKGENKKKINARFVTEQEIKKEHLVSYVPEKAFEKAKGGEKITITYKKKVSDSISFKKINKAKIKDKVWVVVTCNGTTGKLSVEINENKLTNTEAVYDNPVKFLIGEEENTKIEFEIFKDIIVTPNTYAKEITLQPKSKENVKVLVDKFGKRTDKNAFLYFKVESTDPAYEINFFETNKEFLNKEGERLEILGTPCYCNRNIEVDEMIDIIYNLRDKQNYKSERDVFFNKGSENIASIRITSGKLTDNKEKLKLFVNEMNIMFKKFKINTCKRKIHFIGQMYLETISFRYTYESRTEVPSNYKGGVAFQGRGMKQITHDYNYLAYYDYINTTTFSATYMKHRVGYESVGECVENRKKANDLGLDDEFYENLKTFAKNLSENLFHSFNSAGWFSTVYNSSTISAMDGGLKDDDIEKVTKAINGGLNNISERKDYTKWTKEFFKYDTECINK